MRLNERQQSVQSFRAARPPFLWLVGGRRCLDARDVRQRRHLQRFPDIFRAYSPNFGDRLRPDVPGVQSGQSGRRHGQPGGRLAGGQVRLPASDFNGRAHRRNRAAVAFHGQQLLAAGPDFRVRRLHRQDGRPGPDLDGYRESMVHSPQGRGDVHFDDRLRRRRSHRRASVESGYQPLGLAGNPAGHGGLYFPAHHTGCPGDKKQARGHGAKARWRRRVPIIG